eukprot:TRINITY_DN1162_c0_g1_i1.p1 TRINITY_DN1162_c0_g1~~TRINITY_DN1162_c0_g1_i1.p1  ORF type:complete len:341 (-),score=97.33 TRINITY_DN1162_c0_g1_i1:309-1331(-)
MSTASTFYCLVCCVENKADAKECAVCKSTRPPPPPPSPKVEKKPEEKKEEGKDPKESNNNQKEVLASAPSAQDDVKDRIVQNNMDANDEAQQEAIQAEIIKQPLVSEMEAGFASLDKEYSKNAIYLKQISELKARYSGMRRIRGDGNCFYRAFMYGLLEHIISKKDTTLCDALVKTLTKCGDNLASYFDTFTYEDFLGGAVDMLVILKSTNFQMGVKGFHAQLTSDVGMDMTFTTLPRFLVAAYMQDNATKFSKFLSKKTDMATFCNTDVLPVKREADNIQCQALAELMNVPIIIEYMDQSAKNITTYALPSKTATPVVHMLYRPGHYDLIYPATSAKSS